ncbi:MAG: hypothetical protein AAGB07_15610 [Pseudomonadota bacterium]
MYDIDPLLDRIREYAKNAGVSESTASSRVFGRGDELARLEAEVSNKKTPKTGRPRKGPSMTLRVANKAWNRLDELEAALKDEGAVA